MKLRRALCWMGWRSELLWTGNQGGAARGVMSEPTLCVRVSSYTHTCVGPCSTNLKGCGWTQRSLVTSRSRKPSLWAVS